MNNSNALFPPSESTLRPRNNRLISFLDEHTSEESGLPAASPLSREASKFPSRGISPVPARHSSRQPAAGAASRPLRTGAGANAYSSSNKRNISPVTTGLWDSWSSIQGIASTLLGSDVGSNGKTGRNGAIGASQSKKPARLNTAPRPVSQWGPSQDKVPQLAAGSQEERQAMMQAKKREALLLADAHVQTDTLGRHKRRESLTDIPQLCEEEDALVYVHKVQPKDTLAGVLIKYSCQQAIFRKVNRFWPNDNIQIRTHVFLLVEACSVRGRKLETLDGQSDLLGEPDSTGDRNKEAITKPVPFDATTSTDPLAVSLSLTSSHDDNSFKHESWVRMPNTNEPVEILRIPRRTLGFFPPARRKSGTFADEEPYSHTTPKTSFDILRHPPTHAASLNASPSRMPPPTRPRRSASITSTMNGLSFAERLKGPGGVGSLRPPKMTIAIPGPAEDPLNKKFAQYLPNLAPPGDTPRETPIPSFRATPRASTDSIRSTSSAGLAEMGGAIEGWVRKVGGRKGTRTGATGERMGDLIELEGTDMGTVDQDMGEGDETPTAAMTATDEELLEERFPVRGRITEAYRGRSKATRTRVQE